MKTFLGFVTGLVIGAFGFTMLLIIAPESDKLIKDVKDYCEVE